MLTRILKTLLIVSATVHGVTLRADDQLLDPLDPFNQERALLDSAEADSDKSVADLVFEGQMLLQDERPLDARTKLLLALQKDPLNVEAHYLLGSYYTGDVGHYRLALKYAKRAEQLFNEQNGAPPYQQEELRTQHASIIYLLAQIRLNLDDYPGSLALLDQFTQHGYFSSWYPGTRAWVLMKMGRLDEAIKVARMGTLLAAEPGRTLNMLGILLSMKGDRQTALDVLKKATAYELSQGKNGQPATPLNNSGEVYKEMFADDHAETSWIKATSLPDGCQHVLPSLNLTLLYIDQLNLDAAAKVLNSFESCVAQFPLRNGEEHRSLVHLARGRIDLHRGRLESALKHVTAALSGRQWFGKIGTDPADLDAAARVTLFQVYQARENRARLTPHDSLTERIMSWGPRLKERILGWWARRRASQILCEDLQNFEDILIRHTDSLLEYPTLGTLISTFPTHVADTIVAIEDKDDPRVGSNPFYAAYRAAIESARGAAAQASKTASRALGMTRPQKDELLRLSLFLLQAVGHSEDSAEYRALALKAFSISRPSLRNHGLRLPIHLVEAPSHVASALYQGGMLIVPERDTPYSVSYQQRGSEHILKLSSRGGVMGDAEVRGGSLIAVARKLADIVSTLEQD